MSTNSSLNPSDGTPDGLSDWTDIVHNVAQYNPHLSLLSLNSSDELFKRPYRSCDNRRGTSTSSLNSTPDSSHSFKHPGSFVNCFSNRSSTSDLSMNSSISCSPSKFYHTEHLIASRVLMEDRQVRRHGYREKECDTRIRQTRALPT